MIATKCSLPRDVGEDTSDQLSIPNLPGCAPSTASGSFLWDVSKEMVRVWVSCFALALAEEGRLIRGCARLLCGALQKILHFMGREVTEDNHTEARLSNGRSPSYREINCSFLQEMSGREVAASQSSMELYDPYGFLGRSALFVGICFRSPGVSSAGAGEVETWVRLELSEHQIS